MFNWEPGRQHGSYQKMAIWRGHEWLPMDCYLIKYEPGDLIPGHVDPVATGYRHHRVNIVLKRPGLGGVLYINGIKRPERVVYFRPDIDYHRVSVVFGTRLVLSIGWRTRI